MKRQGNIMGKSNLEKRVPKNPVKFDLQLTDEQKAAKALALEYPVNFFIGQAGTGKTLLACQISLDLSFSRKIDKIVITRPTVGTQDDGFLPGDLSEKMDPWMIPLWDNFLKVYNKKEVIEGMKRAGEIEMASLTHFRGRTFDNSVIIVDEFQNLTYHQFKMVITRLGKGSTMIFCGDPEQCDLHTKETGVTGMDRLQECPDVSISELTENHRHPLLNSIMKYL